jgi:NADH-quinone oxidoreductase subunit G
VPHREAGGKALSAAGRNAAEMLHTPLRAYVLFGGVEPEADSLSPQSMKVLAEADLVVAITPYMTEQLKQVAHVVLPIGTFAETSGTYVNLEGVWQSFTAAARGHGESRPGWKVLRVLGTELGIERFEYQTSEEVRDELRRICAEGLPPPWMGSRSVTGSATQASTVDVPMYQVDAVVRRAPSLQRTVEGRSVPATY